MRKIATIVLIVALMGGMGIGLSGCATAPPAPQTVNQKVFYAYGTLDGIATSVETLYRAEVINKKEATDAFNTITKAYNLLKLSEKLYEAGSNGDDSLIRATRLIGAMQDFLLERSKQ